MRRLIGILLAAAAAQAQPLTVGGDYATAFEGWLTAQAQGHWNQRRQELAAMEGAAAVRSRQESVRKTMLDLIGGLPSTRTPLNARVTGQFTRPGYRVDNLIYESQPGLLVTANLYIPTTGKGPYPAVIGVAGHSANGKASSTYQTAFIGFVRAGFAVLAIDPPGQGERSEYFDPSTGRSRAGIGTGEHTMTGLQCLLTGRTFARYEIWDGIRAFDYLLTRPEVDPKRIAVAGNSGGGTQAAYLAVFEPRLAAVVSSCYMTRWEELWSGPGPQDAEQVFPRFVEKGLDFSDFALAWAPRPYLMTTAIQDFFPIAGARATYKEIERLFDLTGGSSKAGYFEYDDTHGWSRPRREAAVRFLSEQMLGRKVEGTEAPVETEEESRLYATPGGQVRLLPRPSETVRGLNRRHGRSLGMNRRPVTVESLKSAIGWRGPGSGVAVTRKGQVVSDGVTIEKLEIKVEGGVSIPALFFRPQGAGAGRAVVAASSSGKGADADWLALAKSGTPVLAVDPRGVGESYRPAGRTGYRQSYQLASRAILLGRNLPEMQAADLVAAAAYLRSRPEAGGKKIALHTRGALGPATLFAAVMDPGIAEIALERSIVRYEDVVNADIHEGLDQAILPGILAHADLPDVIRLLGSRPVWLISPAHPNGKPMLRPEALRSLGGAPAKVVLRGEAWTLARTVPEWFPSARP